MTWRLTALAPLLAAVLVIGPTANSGCAQEDAAPAASFAADDATASDPAAEAQAENGPAPSTEQQIGFSLDNIVLFICAVLVFFMQPGFAMVEAGFNSSKHTVNILFKNALDICVGVLLFWAIGYGLMYPGSGTNAPTDPSPYFAFGGFGINAEVTDAELGSSLNDADPENDITFSPQVDWFFQAAFAATAATIVSGAVAGRMKFGAYMIYSAVITALVYPISGYWKWGGGWLQEMGFYDFAGSAVVHAVGGFAGLAGAIVLGPRIGRYTSDGKPIAIPGHSLPLATLGVFILMVGWYGFNPGSQLAFQGSANSSMMMKIAVNTTLSAAAGGIIATFLSWILFSKPDLSMALNGILAGLVGITANCDGVTNLSSIIIGSVAGVIVVGGIILLDKLRIDDPVGAFPVHGLCGIWGCLAIPIFATYGEGVGTWKAQLVGTFSICGWAFVTMLALFSVLKVVGFLRVSPEEEEKGLDISEHGMSAYAA